MQSITYHITSVDSWLRQATAPDYEPDGFAAEGFIHCTDGEAEVIATGNRYYTADPRDFCLLSIATNKVEPRILYEDDRKIFPHIYGRLNIDAVVAVRRIERDLQGRFVTIGEEL